MGSTANYEGTLKNEEFLSVVIYTVQSYAIYRDWKYKLSNKEPASWIEVFPYPGSEPVRFEFDNNLSVQGHYQTQFEPIDVQGIELLERMKGCFNELKITGNKQS